jgi:hypothetical protein
MDVLSALPRDIDHIHHILFTLPMPFSLSIANHKLFWPLINNAYSIRKLYDVGFQKRNIRPAYKQYKVICRFKRVCAAPLISQGKHASSTKRIITSYDVTFNLLAFPNYYKYILVG